MSGDWRLWPRPSGYSSETAKCAGYNIVVLAVAITVLNILVAKALPLWSTVIQREKEEELIFRGLQYAEAIRLFEGRAGRLPTKLEELIEVKPRCIRKLWRNPMTEDGTWGLIFQDQQGQQLQQPQAQGDQGRSPQQGQKDQAFGVPGDGKEVRVGPIVGVYSTKGGEAIKVFAPPGGGGGTDISEWRFTKDLLQGLGVGAGMEQQATAPSMTASDVGKPWPPGITLPSKLRPDRGGHAGLRGPLDRGQGQNVGGGSGQQPANGRGGG